MLSIVPSLPAGTGARPSSRLTLRNHDGAHLLCQHELDGPLTDEMRVKTRELLQMVGKMREPKALPPRLSDPSVTDGHNVNGESDDERRVIS